MWLMPSKCLLNTLFYAVISGGFGAMTLVGVNIAKDPLFICALGMAAAFMWRLSVLTMPAQEARAGCDGMPGRDGITGERGPPGPPGPAQQ